MLTHALYLRVTDEQQLDTLVPTHTHALRVVEGAQEMQLQPSIAVWGRKAA